MATNYNLQYRVKGTTAWTTGKTGVNRDVNKEMLTSLTGLTFNPTTTYEFRWQRVVDGTITAHSNIVEATLQDTSTIATIPTGGTISSSGTFKMTTGDLAGTTVVRTSTKLVLQLTANWEYVTVEITGASGLPIQGNYYVNKTGTTARAGFTLNSSVIAKTSQKTVDIYLGRDYTYTVTVHFNGNSSGTIGINSF